jgi:hypothetical protein
METPEGWHRGARFSMMAALNRTRRSVVVVFECRVAVGLRFLLLSGPKIELTIVK